MANVLIKPFSERNGNLVILADNTRDIYLIDVTTGEVIEKGRNEGPSNGRDATVRFSRPGSSYKNVGVMDSRGNVILTMPDAGDRVQFNYSDYNALVKTPVSTISGYRWDNSANIASSQSGGISNSQIADMSSDEYLQYLETQKAALGQQSKPSSTTGTATGALALGAAVAPSIINGLEGVNLGNEINVLSGAAEGPLTSFEASGIGNAAANAAGIATAGINAVDAFGNITKGDSAGVTEGVTTLAGTTLGTILGGGVGAGIGSIAGRTAGRGIVAAGRQLGAFGKSTDDYRNERYGAALDNASTEVDKAFVEQMAQNAEKSKGTQTIQTGPLAGRPYSWNEVKQFARPEEIMGEYAFLEAFPNWISGYSNDERVKIAQAALDEKLIDSDKGALLFSGKKGNLDRIKEIAAGVKDGTYQFTKTEAEREAERQQSAEKLGIPYGATPEQPSAIVAPPPEIFAPSEPLVSLSVPGSENVNLRSGMLPSDAGVEPPISGFEQIDGASLPPPGMDNGLMAMNYIQSAPSQSVAQQLMSEAFNPEPIQKDSRLNFEQLQGVFQ